MSDIDLEKPAASHLLADPGSVIRRFFPSPFLCGVALAGALTELLVLVSCDRRWISGMNLLLGLSLLLWIWLTGSWVVHWLQKAANAQSLSHPVRLAANAVLTGLAAVLGAYYVISWSAFIHSGLFIDYGALAYLATGYQFIMHVLLQNSRTVLVLGLLGGCVFCSLIPFGLRRIRQSHWHSPFPLNSGRVALSGWVMLTACWGLTAWLAAQDPNSLRRAERVHLVYRKLNPLLTLVHSMFISQSEPLVPATLDKAKLTPLPADRRPHTAASYPDPLRRRHVFFLGVDSFRADVLFKKVNGREITPRLNQLAARSAVFTNCYAQSTHTDYALVSCLSSLYPLRRSQHLFYSASDPWPRTMIYDLLKSWGYTTAIITSDNTKWGRMNQALRTPQLDIFVDPTAEVTSITQPILAGEREVPRSSRVKIGNVPDQVTTDRIIRWLHANADSSTPLFLHSFFQDTHFPYDVPLAQEHPFQPCEVPQEISFVRYPPELAENLRNAYYNAVLHIDRQFGRILDALEETGMAENSIVVIFGDHGEAFHERGVVTHAGIPVQPVIRVPCIIFAPGLASPRLDDYPVQQIDMVPTVCALMGMEPHPNFQGINVLAEDRPPAEERRLFIHVETPLASADVLIEGGQWKLWIDRMTNEVALYDVVSDPGEERNLFPTERERIRDLFSKLQAWRTSQLAYYAYPFYYEACYPPR